AVQLDRNQCSLALRGNRLLHCYRVLYGVQNALASSQSGERRLLITVVAAGPSSKQSSRGAIYFDYVPARIRHNHRFVDRVNHRIGLLLLDQQAPVIGPSKIAQSREHPIEFGSQHPYLILRRSFYVLIKITLANSSGLLCKRGYWIDYVIRKSPRKNKREGQRDDGAEGH